MNAKQGNEPSAEQDGVELVDATGKLFHSYRYDYAGRCWWCGLPADSGEHKHKRTDLVRAFGPGPWKGQTAVVQVIEENSKDLQSPGAEHLKFTKVLCGNCNSARSQQFDQAYDRFANYIISNQENILDTSELRWSHIFGREWKHNHNLVIAYWLKHIGCRFADGGIEVDPAIVKFLNNPVSISCVPLRMELQIHDDWAAVYRHWKSHNQKLNAFWMGDLMCLYSRSQHRIDQATCHWGIGWLRLTYQYDTNYSRVSLNFWKDKVCLAHISNVDVMQVIANCEWCKH